MGLPEITVESVANGMLAIIVGMLSWLGYRQVKPADPAKAHPPAPERRMEISGVLMDKRHAEQIIEAVNENTDAVRTKTSETVALANAINELRSDMRELTRELIRMDRR